MIVPIAPEGGARSGESSVITKRTTSGAGPPDGGETSILYDALLIRPITGARRIRGKSPVPSPGCGRLPMA
jgi:hypothetical protein